MTKEQIKIPTSKIQRAASFAGAGAKVGGNYIKYYVKKALNPDLNRDELNENNAEDIYGTLSKLKGSALKVAQMLSMDKNLMPQAYQDKFQMAQYSAPPLSYPLVVKTFNQEFKKSPTEIFDTFSKIALQAASIGQVHKAELKGHTYAVKVQYPGVAASVSSDLKLVKPLATRILNLKGKDIGRYFKEVETKLLEETDYKLELARSIKISEASAHIANVVFPKYYPALSGDRILTMDWIEGVPLTEFTKQNHPQEIKDKIGQALWDFYDFQIFKLKAVHADPHPGNFIITPDFKLGVIDFGCVKEIEEQFHKDYFTLLNSDAINNDEEFTRIMYKLEFLLKDDDAKIVPVLKKAFQEMLNLLGKPFNSDNFDFGDDAYFKSIYALGEKFSKMVELKEANGARGPQDAIYINRTCFGLYSILNQIGAKVKIIKQKQ
ncbi:MAG: AarF/ABC1/UbiB kinase family protein [bacterium]|nr:AarF/ABC1/UbiB kinase family protein [bacterium]